MPYSSPWLRFLLRKKRFRWYFFGMESMSRARFSLWLLAAASLLACALASRPARAGKAVDVEAVQRAIAEAGAGWTAGPTPLTEMTPEELDLVFPEVDPLEGIAEAPADEPGPPPPPPPHPDPSLSRFSWRDYDGGDWMTDVRDQGMCGACVAFSTLASVEAQYNIAIGDASVDLDLCEQFLVSCTSLGCDGGRIDDALDYLRSTGVPDEMCFPYFAAEIACGSRCSDWASRTKRISSWGWAGSTTSEIKAQLVRGPLVASMDVYGDFLAYTGGVYSHVTGEREGSHAVTIVGWDDTHSSWICRNSWGPLWGDGGYFEIRRNEECLDRRKAYVTVSMSSIPGHPCLDPHRQAVEVMSGGDPVSVTATMVNCGGGALDWTASPDPDTGWFSVVPATGSGLLPGGSVELTGTVDPETLTRIGEWGASFLVTGGLADARSYVDIDVIASPMVPGFEAEPTSGPAPLTVRFTNTSTGVVTSSGWDFGDGETGDGRDPEHVYGEAGIFSVTLEIVGPTGRDSVTREDYITVTPPSVDDLADAVAEIPDGPDAGTDPGGGSIVDSGGCGCIMGV
jgi:hypothetical protein